MSDHPVNEPAQRTASGLRVAVIGAGWAGLAAAVQACRLGHQVTVFEASLRGSGEGHYGWENADGSTGTMTNGTVGKLTQANGRTLSVSYKGGEKQLVVPDDVPIAYVQAGKVDELVKGAKVVVFPAEDGKTARGVAVGKDGFQPPM